MDDTKESRVWKDIFETKKISIIQFQFTTPFGDLRHVSFPARIWESMSEGAGVDGSSLGFLKTEQSDLFAVPDLNSFAVVPWNRKVGRFICDLVENDTRKPHPADPRSILKKMLAQAKALGYDYITRPELEWYFVNNPREVRPLDNGKYMDIVPFDQGENLRYDIVEKMLDQGMGVKTIHHECGPSQHEIEFLASEALRCADDVQTTKIIAKAEANQHNITCTFMPKPFIDQAGSGFHIHQWLANSKGENIFAEKGKAVCDTLRWFVGGILEHVDDMTAIFNPTTNSYKRLVIGHEAPVYKAWGVGNRTALIRIPGYEKKARFEYRATDCATNVYLATALLLAAGLDGLKRKIEPCSQPTIKNVEHLTVQERKEMGIGQLPGSLKESLDNFENSEFMKNILGPECMSIFLTRKRQEWEEYLKAKEAGLETEIRWEYNRYLERA